MYRNHRDDKPGHTAIVRPSAKADAAIVSEGPDIIQAGGTNYNVVSLGRGFAVSARYTGFFSLPRDAGPSYQRHTAYLGLSYSQRLPR